jgi:uncharacterized repeat protein (TIGR02543 family)
VENRHFNFYYSLCTSSWMLLPFSFIIKNMKFKYLLLVCGLALTGVFSLGFEVSANHSQGVNYYDISRDPSPADTTLDLSIYLVGGAIEQFCSSGFLYYSPVWEVESARIVSGPFSGTSFNLEKIHNGVRGDCNGGGFLGEEHKFRAYQTFDTSSLSNGTHTIWVEFHNSHDTNTYGFTFDVQHSTPPTGTIYVTSNLSTSWTISGPENLAGSGTSATYNDKPTGTYTIYSDDIACYSKSVNSSTQTLSGGGSISFDITYTWIGCEGPTPVYGCTDPNANNYDPAATHDDGSCTYDEPPPPTNNPPSCSSVAPQSATTNATSGIFYIYAYGVQNASSVAFPTWSDVNGQDDIVWYSGAYIGDNTWRASVDLGAHRVGNPDYGQFQSHVYMSNADHTNVHCGNATFVRESEPPPACSPFGHDDCATFSSQTICGVSNPSSLTMTVGQVCQVSITLTNVGNNTTWTCCGGSDINTSTGYKLGSQNWQDNYTWGQARTGVPYDVGPGQPVTFNFNITAPMTPNTYNFQRRMVNEHVRWFGEYTPNVSINVVANTTLTVSINSGSGTITGSGISCPGDCSETYNTTTDVILTASPASGYRFTGWTDACAGYGTNTSCTINVAVPGSNVHAGANFEAIPPPFDYSLSSTNVNVTKTGTVAYGQSEITKTLIAGVTEVVTLSVTSSLPPGVTVQSISNQGCAPGCTSNITFAVQPSAPTGQTTVTVTGVSTSGVTRTTNFTLNITGNPSTVSCSSSPSGTAMLGEPVTWTASVSGGTPPHTITWSGTNIPTNPAPTCEQYTITYTTIGLKTAVATVTDAAFIQSTCTDGSGGPGGSIYINFDPTFEEF